MDQLEGSGAAGAVKAKEKKTQKSKTTKIKKKSKKEILAPKKRNGAGVSFLRYKKEKERISMNTDNPRSRYSGNWTHRPAA